MIGVLRYLVALACIVTAALVGLFGVEAAMGVVPWLLAAIAVSLLGDPPIGRRPPS
jgi:hypothetical protein